MTANTHLRLLTVDLDDTLWPCYSTIRRAEDALYGWLRSRAPRLTDAYDQERLRSHRKGVALDNPGIAYDLTAVRRTSLQELLMEFGYGADPADEAMACFLHHRNQVEPYADVVPALRDLGTRYRLVSVTNGNSDISRTPLHGLFHLSLTAADVGAQRPDPALFRAALEWAGLAPEEALHLGDSPLLDVEAARQIGMCAVWVNREGRSWPAELDPPVAEVTDMNGLKSWLKGTQHGI